MAEAVDRVLMTLRVLGDPLLPSLPTEHFFFSLPQPYCYQPGLNLRPILQDARVGSKPKSNAFWRASGRRHMNV
jgi:hypothetical protein